MSDLGPPAVAAEAAGPPGPDLGISDGDGVGSGDDAARPKEKKTVQQVGLSVYIRKKIKAEDKDGQMKTKTFWVLEGRTLGDHDREFLWEERRAKDGSTQYRNAATGRSTRQLPDMGPTKSAVGLTDPTQQLSPRRVKQQPREGWTQDKKTAVQAYVRKQLSRQVRDGSIEPLTAEIQKILVKNVADSYMSSNEPFDGELLPRAAESVLTADTQAQLAAWLDDRNEQAERAQAEAEMPDLTFLSGPALDDDAALPDKADKAAPPPQSPFLPRANYLRDPYYYMRTDYPNPRRTVLEEELENKLFFTPNMGEIKVLGAVHGWNCHPADPRQHEPCIVAVAQDWSGACCLMYIQPPGVHIPEHSITATYPICEHVEFRSITKHIAPKSGDALRTFLLLDDQWHAIGVKSVDDQRYLELCLKLAMSLMYGKGADDGRVVSMRARSVEFAWNHNAPVPDDVAIAKFERLMTATDEELERGGDVQKQTDQLVHDLRMYMLAADKRDALLRRWVSHVTKRREPVRSEVLLRQLRLVEEAIRYPAPSNDPFLADHVQKALATAELELSRSRDSRDDVDDAIGWKASPGRLAQLWRILSHHSADFVSRDAVPDHPPEACFQPAPGSEAADIQRQNLQLRHANFREHQLPSGIYLSALIYTGDTDATREILTDSHNNLPSELIETQLTEKHIQTLTRESADFKWLAQHGVDPNWAEDIQVWSQLYDNSGTGRFRAYFLEATRKMQRLLGRYEIGIIFDDVVVLPEVMCMHIITVLRLNRKEDMPFLMPAQQDWMWQPAIDAEYQCYLKSFLIRASTRVAFMPSGYDDCRRWFHACMLHNESVERRVPAGLYLGFFGCRPAASEFQCMVVGSHRHLVPLARIQAEFPTLEQWRWVQCLNEKRRRVGSFEWHTVSTKVAADAAEDSLPTFRHKFLRAVLELQNTTGRQVEHIYDLEIITFDEAREIKVIAVVERFLVPPPPHTPPHGTAPLVWKNWELAEAQYLKLYWPRAWSLFMSARSAADAAQRRVMQPFTADEALRLDQTGALQHYMEMERFFLPLRWFWTLWTWAGQGYPTVVTMHEGAVERTVVRGIEESVEIAVSNYATQQDINHLTMKSLAMDAGREHDWDSLVGKLREIERTMKHGYAQRVHQPDTVRTEPVPQERTWDELYSDEGSDDMDARPPTMYELDCTIEEFVERDGADPSAYFAAQDIVKEIVESSMIDSIDVGTVKICGECISNMISVLEVTDAVCNDAVVEALKEEATDLVLEERDRYQRGWLDVFADADDAGLRGLPVADDDELSDTDLGDETAAAFETGSSLAIQSPDEGIRVCIARSMDAVHQIESLLRVVNSAQEALELTDCISEYDAAVARQVGIIKSTVEPHGGGRSPGRPRSAATAATSLAALSPAAVPHAASPVHMSPPRHEPHEPPQRFAPAAAPQPPPPPPPPAHDPSVPEGAVLTMVSSDYRQYRIPVAEASRALALKSAKGKIRFPEVHSSLLSLVAYFLSLPEPEVASFLLSMENSLQQAGVQPPALLGLATQLKAPLLTLRCAALLYGTPIPPGQDGQDRAITGSAPAQLKTALEGSYLMSFGVRDWLDWEAVGGPAVAPVLDALWWVRYLREAFPASSDPAPAFTEYEQAWKQMYAETRVRVFLSRGVDQLQREEVSLWGGPFGELVQYLSFRDRSIGDEEIEVLTSCCPNLKSVDVSGTRVTDNSVHLLRTGCRSLCDINVDGSRITPHGRQQLTEFTAANASRGMAVAP